MARKCVRKRYASLTKTTLPIFHVPCGFDASVNPLRHYAVPDSILGLMFNAIETVWILPAGKIFSKSLPDQSAAVECGKYVSI